LCELWNMSYLIGLSSLICFLLLSLIGIYFLVFIVVFDGDLFSPCQSYQNQWQCLNVWENCEGFIQPSTFELYNFVPIEKLGSSDIKFAPIGLTNMFNSGGTIQQLKYIEKGDKVKGGGRFLVYSSESPKKFQLDGSDVAF